MGTESGLDNYSRRVNHIVWTPLKWQAFCSEIMGGGRRTERKLTAQAVERERWQ